MAATASKRRAAKTHLHIENFSGLGEVFEATPKRVREALKRYPDVAKRLKVTVGYDRDIFHKQIETAEAVFGWDFDRAAVKAAPNLKWVSAHGAGVTHLMPLDWLPEGAVLTNSSGVHGERGSEYAIMAVLMLNNRVPEMVTSQRKGQWRQVFNTAIAGKTLLIIGVGSVGGSAARHAKYFGLEVLGIRRSGKPHRYVDRMYRPRDLRRLLPRADFVLMCAPDTKDSHHMIGRRELDLMKKGAGIANYSRAGLIDYDALRAKLEKGELIAILDVFDPEPLPRRSPLWRTPNLVMTPHCSSDDAELYTPKTLDLVLENMARFLAGRKLKNIIDPKLEY